jgi:hypothetical protein
VDSKPSYRATALFGGAGALLAVLLLLAGWLAALDARPDASASAAQKTAHDQRAAAADELGVQYDEPYAPQMVTDRVAWTYLGKRTIDVALINATTDADLEETARACLKRNLPGHEFAQCYVFDSKREYEYKNISSNVELPKGTPATGLTILCYEVLGRQEPGKAPVIANMRDTNIWHAQGCPGW